ncbi:MAG TPA: DUF445 domain-containing protein [Noviherbaspirillum sp.]|jgi:uncharacterized membrane-anchored protein YjiN (DUF445 family)|uniref:DUF445 domain-containing protein n=1 Tax=Noviherbaspirillum sp. TaxID=1926288 RepID=UPI002DDD4D71|nr:DUF445 domain-containing protein [Noviherbaspirillum sp.]HEV2612962.1 DUF445 domain-containing protein [Noviherbaspirillum sp.]
MLEERQAAQFIKIRRLATGLLVLMAVIFVICRIYEPQYAFLAYVSAFAEAAMVGALADWFAVTALFRSPLGLPIPHTAIIPRNKDRIGESLSDFLEHNFMTPEIIREELDRLDFSGMVASWLSRPENSRAVSRQIVRSIPALLKVVEDDDVRHFMQNRITSALQNTRFAPILAEIISMLAANRHHQKLFDHLLGMAARALENNKPYIRWKIHESSPRWMPKAIDQKLYERLLDALESTLAEMKEEDSEWRARFQKSTDELIEQLKTSPEYGEKIDAVVMDIAGHPLFRNYSVQVWHDLKARLEADALAEDSQMAVKLEQALLAFGTELLRDDTVQVKLNRWIREFAVDAIVKRREMIADLVARVIRKWDAETISRKLELHVGKDLQYIRINGTLVGGVVGLLLHVVSGML